MNSPPRDATAKGRAIVTPLVDALCMGGASFLVFALVLLFATGTIKGQAKSTLFAIGIALNWPHFVASYRMLYSSRESILRYRVASIYFPLVLALYSIFAIATWERHPFHNNLILVIGSIYLARHYTGQAWGMIATSAYTTGVTIAPAARRLIRGSLDLMMLWHASWAAAQSIGLVAPSLVEPARALYAQMMWVAGASLAMGATGFVLLARQQGRLPPARLLLPWAAIYIWYALLAKDASAIFLLQGAHALQYLIFPLRVETNRQGAPGPRSWKMVALSFGAWVLIGAAVFEGLGPGFKLVYHLGGGQTELPDIVQSIVVSAISIHHFFIDGALYKLRNPEVRRDLFAHLQPLERPAVAAAAAAG